MKNRYSLDGESSIEFRELSRIEQGYIRAAFWAAPENISELSFFDLHKNTLSLIINRCEKFETVNIDHICTLLEEKYFCRGDRIYKKYLETDIGIDFWLSQNNVIDAFVDHKFSGDAAHLAAEKLDDYCETIHEGDFYVGDGGKIYMENPN